MDSTDTSLTSTGYSTYLNLSSPSSGLTFGGYKVLFSLWTGNNTSSERVLIHPRWVSNTERRRPLQSERGMVGTGCRGAVNLYIPTHVRTMVVDTHMARGAVASNGTSPTASCSDECYSYSGSCREPRAPDFWHVLSQLRLVLAPQTKVEVQRAFAKNDA